MEEKLIGVLGVHGFSETQESIFSYLKHNRVHPAILLGGPDPNVKFALAKGMAKTLLCRSKKENGQFDPSCPTCQRIEKEVHPDVYIHRELDANSIKIEQVRQLCHQMEVTSMEGGAKICIVDECHRMTAPAANAFLKSLEEPGPDRYFLLLTSQLGSLLSTIISRCIQFQIKPEAGDEEGFPKEESDFQDAMGAFLQSENTIELKKIVTNKETCARFVSFLQRQLRAAILEKEPSLFSKKSALNNLQLFDATLDVEQKLRSNVNHGLIVENLLVQHFTKEASL